MSIEFHRHCQATVLSANGTGSQNGESWYIINELSGKLSNLPNGWIDYFKQNKQCITEDFASILNIINNVSGNVVRKIKLNNVEKTPVNGLVDLGTIVPQASNENCVDRRGDTMTGFLTLHSDPTLDMHAATKKYVDTLVSQREEVQPMDCKCDQILGELENLKKLLQQSPSQPSEPSDGGSSDNTIILKETAFSDLYYDYDAMKAEPNKYGSLQSPSGQETNIEIDRYCIFQTSGFYYYGINGVFTSGTASRNDTLYGCGNVANTFWLKPGDVLSFTGGGTISYYLVPLKQEYSGAIYYDWEAIKEDNWENYGYHSYAAADHDGQWLRITRDCVFIHSTNTQSQTKINGCNLNTFNRLQSTQYPYYFVHDGDVISNDYEGFNTQVDNHISYMLYPILSMPELDYGTGGNVPNTSGYGIAKIDIHLGVSVGKLFLSGHPYWEINNCHLYIPTVVDTTTTVSSSLITNSVINVTDHEVYLELSDTGDLLIKKTLHTKTIPPGVLDNVSFHTPTGRAYERDGKWIVETGFRFESHDGGQEFDITLDPGTYNIIAIGATPGVLYRDTTSLYLFGCTSSGSGTKLEGQINISKTTNLHITIPSGGSYTTSATTFTRVNRNTIIESDDGEIYIKAPAGKTPSNIGTGGAALTDEELAQQIQQCRGFSNTASAAGRAGSAVAWNQTGSARCAPADSKYPYGCTQYSRYGDEVGSPNGYVQIWQDQDTSNS